MNQNLSRTLHRQLVQLRGQAQDWAAGRPSREFNPALGICHNLSLSPASRDALYDLIARWPARTGAVAFPVPHPTQAPGLAYVYSPPDQMWNPVHEYARNRLALLDWLIEQTAPSEESQS